MQRTIYAKIIADEDKLSDFQETNGLPDTGVIDGFIHEFMWMTPEFDLDDAMIADDDSTEPWDRYINYLLEYAFSHSDPEYSGSCDDPMSYSQWKEKEGVR